MTVKDRLDKLRSAHGDEAQFVDISLSMEEGENFMDCFFKECEGIRESLDDVESDVASVDKKHSLILSNPVNDEKTKEELDQLMVQIKKKTKKLQIRLQAIEKSIAKDERNGVVSADLRIRKSQHSALSRRFVTLMAEYNRVQSDYRDRCKQRISRQLDIAGRSVDEESLEEMIESGDPQIFTQGIITEAEDMKKTLADIEARHSDILKLEKSIIELHEMFMDMAMLVESQGEVIDRVEYNVVNAQDYVDKAVADTKKAQAFQSKARRKKIIIMIMLSVIVCVLVLILIFTIK